MEEFIACGMYPLAVGAGFDRVATRMTPISKLKVPLPKFGAFCKDNNEDDVQFLVRVELEAKGIIGSYTKVEHNTCLAHVRNRGRLNCIFELAGVAYRPHAVPGTDEFTKAMQKRKLDTAGKNSSKCPKAVGKKKMDAAKIAPSRGKARPLKQSKKTMVHLVAVNTTRVSARALSYKVVASASGAKGMANVKKIMMPIRKRHVPAIGAMAVASSEESQESSPHGRAARDSMAKITSRSKPRGQSSWASLPSSVPRVEPEAPLQVTAPLDIGGASILDVTTAVATG
jgi:hypothetical protein